MTNSDRRTFLRVLGGTALAASLPDSIARAMAIPANHRDRHDRGHRAHRRPDAGEPLVRPLLRHAARRARLRRSPRRAPAVGPAGVASAERPAGDVLPFHPHRAATWACSSCRIWPTTGPDPRRLERRAITTSGCRPRAPRRWPTSTAQDIPFHYALADAFTICDAYHCSLLGPDRSEPLPHVDRLGRQRRLRRRTGHRQRRGRLRLVDLSRSGWRRPACPGRSTRTSASA